MKNYGRMYQRRVAFKIGVTYQTPREKIEKIRFEEEGIEFAYPTQTLFLVKEEAS